ncbi:hypothetical protein ACSBR2_024467 [Camellia fascicularis]
MASEEVSKPPSLPPYPEMILAALDALKEKDGSNKSAISKYIESTYGDLPAGHTTLLSHHLNRMKETGQLVFAKNNYMRFDPNAPPRRGRGRPPKPKSPMPPGALPSPSRPRGRPPKDPNAPPPPPKKVSSSSSSSSSVGSGRPRGRPPKSGGSSDGGSGAGEKSGRPRGRPPKVKPQQAQVGVQAN